MRPAKPDYYDPTLRGREDGKGMENLPRITAPPPRKSPALSLPLESTVKPSLLGEPSRQAESAPEQNPSKLSTAQLTAESTNQSTDQSATQSTGRPTAQSITQSTTQSTGRLVGQSTSEFFDQSTILGRPKSFYITRKQNEDLNIVVEKLSRKIGERIHQRIDRSTVMRLLLEESNLVSDAMISRLASRLASRLINQLKG